jgi:hypothetical protein
MFVSTMTEKMTIYALGRGVEAHDMPVIRRIVRDAAKEDYRFSSIVRGIVHSVPFQMRVKLPPPAKQESGIRSRDSGPVQQQGSRKQDQGLAN